MNRRLSMRGMIMLLALAAPSFLPLPAQAAEPCCEIVSIEAPKSIVVVKHRTTGQRYQVTIANKRALSAFRVGQEVELSAAGRIRVQGAGPLNGAIQLRIHGAEPIAGIVRPLG